MSEPSWPGLEGLRSDVLERLERIVVLLEGAESRFRDVVLSCADGILILDGLGCVVFANPAAEALLGRSLREMVGEPFAVVAAADQDGLIDVLGPGGARRLIELRSVRTRWTDEDVEIVSLRDVTEHAAADRSRAEATERLQRALRGAGDGLWEWDLATGRVDCGPGLCMLLGLPSDEPLSTEAWLSVVHPEDADSLRAAVELHLDGKTAGVSRVVRLRAADGGWTPALLAASASCRRRVSGVLTAMAASPTG